jgi:uncharacterized protein (TIGR03067 family)
MRFVLSALVVAATTTLAFAQAKEKAKDEDAIQGTWKVEKFDLGVPGGPSKDELKTMRFVFKKDGKMAMAVGPRGEKKEGEYKMDPAAKMKTIDWVRGDRIQLGIYELDGDTLKICISEGGQKGVRPSEMKPDGKNIAVFTLKRVKEEKKEEK